MSYKYDLFISYKWGGERKEWVDNIFVPLLRDVFYEETGTKGEIFKDTDKIILGASLPQSLKDAIAYSKCMISIISLPYFTDSLWCPTEFSAMLYREEVERIRENNNNVGIIFPVIFVDESEENLEDRNPIYKYQKYRDLLVNVGPLELSLRKYNNTNKAFKESEDYNNLKYIIRKWFRRSIAPVLKSVPDWRAEWRTDKFLIEPYQHFQKVFIEGFKGMSIPSIR